MSLPANILSTFRSYSYHQILIACDSTQTADILSASTEITDFQHERDKELYTPRQVKGGTGFYVVIIDGMSDVTYNINSASWETVIAPNTSTTDGMSLAFTMELDGQLEIFEPNGANFLNTLSNISDSLGSDPNGLIFMLKTIFVGWHDDGRNQELITTVRPLLFCPYDITAVFDQSGAKYTFTFVGVANGVGKTAPVTSIGGGKSISIKPKQTLKSAIQQFNDIVNESYSSFKKSLQEKYDKAGLNIKLDEQFRLVNYKFNIVGYDDAGYIAGDIENVRVSNTSGDPVLHFNNSLGIEEALSKIMKSSKKVVSEEPKYIFKILSDVESTPEEYTVTYTIQRYELKTVELKKDPADIEVEDGQVIEFDYVFTGKNIDIIDLDIKMDLGMAFFQTLTSAQNLPNQQDTLNGTKQSIANGSGGGATKTSSTNQPRKNTPLYLGSSLGDSLIRNTKKPIDALGFQAMLNRHAALENIQAAVTIYGNPQLLDEMLPSGEEIVKGETEKPKKDQTINPKWLSIPTMVKINIKMPIDANDFSKGFKPFWYEGYYSLFAVNNKFENGEFTQVLDLFSIPVVDESNQLTEDVQSGTDVSKEKKRNNIQATTDQTKQTPDDASKVLSSAKTPTTSSNKGNVDNSSMTIAQKIAARNARRRN